MRDDFKSMIKDLLAKRVGYRCSNPGCRQPTCGPQADPKGTINIGVAAHITAASPDGPRYNSQVMPEQRSADENGIWLCQTCGKLVDSDESRYTVDALRDWKERAEATAARELEQRLSRYPNSAGIFSRMERLMPALLAEMRQDLAQNPLRRELVIMERSWSYWAKGNELIYFYDDHPELDSMLLILQNERLIRDITFNNVKRYLMSEQLAEYLGAP